MQLAGIMDKSTPSTVEEYPGSNPEGSKAIRKSYVGDCIANTYSVLYASLYNLDFFLLGNSIFKNRKFPLEKWKNTKTEVL